MYKKSVARHGMNDLLLVIAFLLLARSCVAISTWFNQNGVWRQLRWEKFRAPLPNIRMDWILLSTYLRIYATKARLYFSFNLQAKLNELNEDLVYTVQVQKNKVKVIKMAHFGWNGC